MKVVTIITTIIININKYKVLTCARKEYQDSKFYLLNWVAVLLKKSSLGKQMTESWMELWPYLKHF